ncbi:MAG: hypothetical protein ACKO7B_08225, partial [Flavobacteriales bacterium]
SAATSPRGISAAAFRSLLQSGVGGMNYSYEQRMAFPYQTVIPVGNPPYAANILLDAVAARDNWTSSTPDSSGFLQSNKNGDNPKTWNIGVSNIPDKNDILDVGGHVRRFTTSPSLPGDLWGYAYASTKGTNGTSYVDFEIYRTAPVFTGANPANTGPDSSGGHTAGVFYSGGALKQPGDLLVSIDYINGGTTPVASVRVWVNAKKMIEGTTYSTYAAGIAAYNALPASVRLFEFTGDYTVSNSTNGYGYFEIRPKTGANCL